MKRYTVIFYNPRTKKFWFKSFGSKKASLKGALGISNKTQNMYVGEDLCTHKNYNIYGMKIEKPFTLNSKGFNLNYWNNLKRIIKKHKC